MSTSHDFDFLLGDWVVHHRRLKNRLVQCAEWETFPGTCQTRTLLGGSANVDDHTLEAPAGSYRAAALRAFDPGTRKWSIWWLDGHRPDQLGVPVVGKFHNGVGTFLADDVWEGKPIKVHFIWSDVTANSARWQQAFSSDEGKTWEINWIMDFIRVQGDNANPRLEER